jgi:hypothetical protein
MARFTCAECGKGVIVVDNGEKLRHCEHTSAAIVAHLEAILYSHGTLEVKEKN